MRGHRRAAPRRLERANLSDLRPPEDQVNEARADVRRNARTRFTSPEHGASGSESGTKDDLLRIGTPSSGWGSKRGSSCASTSRKSSRSEIGGARIRRRGVVEREDRKGEAATAKGPESQRLDVR